MEAKPRDRRGTLLLLGCFLCGLIFALAYDGFHWLETASSQGPKELLVATLMILGVSVFAGLCAFFPLGLLLLGWLSIGKYEQKELAELPDDNTVGDPEVGERKYQQWLSGMNSTEAWLGMIPRSEPYVPPELRPPPDIKAPGARLSRRGWITLSTVTGCGAFLGTLALGSHTQGSAGWIQMLTAAAVGAILSLPVGVVSALLFGRIEETQDESGRLDES